MKIDKNELRETPVTKWKITDSDGTVVPLNADASATRPSTEFLEQIRQYSFENRDTAIVVLSGRKDSELYDLFYKNALEPNAEGVVPKVILASENGAFIRVSSDPENVHKLAEPLSEELQSEILNMIKEVAGKYFTSELSEAEIMIRPEMKTFGCTCHYRISDEEGSEILDKIKEGLSKISENNPGFHLDFAAANAFTIERVSKGATITKLIDRSDDLRSILDSVDFSFNQALSMSYVGDDRGDWPALNAVDERILDGTLKEGYTMRPSNHSPNTPDVASRLPNGPKETGSKNALFILGTKDKSAQEMHREYFLSDEYSARFSELRVSLQNRGMLPTQNEESKALPIVLLSSGDILIQEPERYPQETLENLKDWDKGKVVLLASEENPQSLKIKELARDNANIVAVSPEGAVYQQGEYLDLASSLTAAKADNKITSANESRSEEIQQLRAIQATLVSKGILIPKAIAPAAKQEQPTQEDVKPAAQQEVQSDAQQQEQPAVAQETAAAGRQEPPAEAEAAVVAPPVAQAAETSALGQLAVRPSSPGTVAGRTINRRRGRDSSQQTTQPAKKSRGARM
jgi:trehalose-phosphatase